VPLLVKLPRSDRGGTTVTEPVALVDLLPTLASLLDLRPPAGLPGRALFGAPGPPRRIYAETFYPRLHLGWSDLRSLVDDRWQYIEGRRRELYDLAVDPRQVSDVLAAHGEVGRSRQKELAGFPAQLRLPAEVGTEERERLAALGYLGGAVAVSGSLPDPRESLPALERVKAAFRLAAADKGEEAVEVFRKVLAEYPHLVDARFKLGQTLVQLGRYEEAYEAFRAAIRSSPPLAGAVALHLGRVCLKLGRHEEAEANARIGLRLNPSQAHELLARIALSRDDLAAAEREALAATGDAASELAAAVVRAEVRIRQERFAEALAVIEAAKKVGERSRAAVPDLDFLRGDALARLGRYDEAEAAFREEIQAFPKNSQAWARLAIVYGLQGRRLREVDRLLERMVAANPTPETEALAAKTLESLGDHEGASAWRRRTRPSPARLRSLP
jgi:tetratricopeptide (TPR) repeat protein